MSEREAAAEEYYSELDYTGQHYNMLLCILKKRDRRIAALEAQVEALRRERDSLLEIEQMARVLWDRGGAATPSDVSLIQAQARLRKALAARLKDGERVT